jgi:monolysocardiolipin acyltransferase
VLFRSGKVIDTVRGVGVYQDAIDLAIQRLDVGDWVHIFPQGYVRQETSKPPIGRLKWGMYVFGVLFGNV